SHLVDHFIDAGYDTSGFCRGEVAPGRKNPQCHYVHGNLLDTASFLPLLDRYDVIIQAAQLDLAEEYQAISAMLDGIRGSGKTFIMTSGTGVLSQRTDGDWSEDTFAEDDAFVP